MDNFWQIFYSRRHFSPFRFTICIWRNANDEKWKKIHSVWDWTPRLISPTFLFHFLRPPTLLPTNKRASGRPIRPIRVENQNTYGEKLPRRSQECGRGDGASKVRNRILAKEKVSLSSRCQSIMSNPVVGGVWSSATEMIWNHWLPAPRGPCFRWGVISEKSVFRPKRTTQPQTA